MTIATARLLSLFAAVTMVVSAVVATPAAAGPPLSIKTQIFYYPWYRNPTIAAHWRHWEETGFNPPNDISSNYYPALGPYDSGDFKGAVAQQMADIRDAGIGIIIYSWWGQGSLEDQLVAGTLDVADRFGIKVAWHIEPYDGRNANSVVSDIEYITSRYGSHPAFFRDHARGDKGVFYIYYNLLTANWSPLKQVRANSLVLAETTDVSAVGDFDGMYTYAVAGKPGQGWAGASAYAHAHNMIWAPSIGPGYLDDRAVRGNATETIDRSNGATYDLQWQTALTPTFGTPDWITITSFNEWHEGSQIEPASNTPPAGFGYLTYLHAYDLTGPDAERAYITRTRVWVDMFDPQVVNLVPNPSFEITASGASLVGSWRLGTDHGRSGEMVHTGRWALKSAFAQGGGASTRTSPIAVAPNTDYTISAWVYDASGTGAACLDLNDIPLELQICTGPAIGWQLLAGTWNSQSNRTVIIRLVTDGGPNGPIYFDDVSLRPVN